MKLQHLRRHAASPSLGGIWYVRFRPRGHFEGPWPGDEAETSSGREEERNERQRALGLKVFGLRPALAGTAGALGLAILTTVVFVS